MFCWSPLNPVSIELPAVCLFFSNLEEPGDKTCISSYGTCVLLRRRTVVFRSCSRLAQARSPSVSRCLPSLSLLICMTFALCVLRAASVMFLTVMSYFPLLYSPMNPERCDTKSLARVNQARPRDVQAKKQPSATLPSSSKPAGGTAVATRHRDTASGTKKASKPTGKAGSSIQVKANPRNTTNTNRGNGKFSSVCSRLARQNPQLPASLHGECACVTLCGRRWVSEVS